MSSTYLHFHLNTALSSVGGFEVQYTTANLF